ncbi:MAG TPA: UDP-N-acetylglucosamine 2-epimerase (non-hydrolyzing) [Ohtaekwangia sp.]|nr:UDP-N-acetylglucosamine 2-epimerase (non-hydrolyzing) [Ohtaekwangia sp.]
MKRILIIVGTRPEAIKLFPVVKAFKADKRFQTLLLTSGQHGEGMMAPLINFFEIEVDVALNTMVPNQSISEFASLLMLSLDKEIEKHKPDLVIVQGDTTSCMVGSLTAFYRGIKVAHVEAGLRTYNRQSPYPEEINRRITSLLTDLHFAPTENAKLNLKKEGVEGRVDVVGNTVIDSLLEASDRINRSHSKYKQKYSYLVDKFTRIILITGHRRENIGSKFGEIYSAIKQLAEIYPDFAFVYPLHVNPAVRYAAQKILSGSSNIFLIEPLPYDEMVFLMRESYLVMTDSGGIQEECPSLNIPVLVLRDTTERPEGIEAGCSVLAGVETHFIIETFIDIVNDENRYNKMSRAQNPFGKGDSSLQIVKIVSEFFSI